MKWEWLQSQDRLQKQKAPAEAMSPEKLCKPKKVQK